MRENNLTKREARAFLKEITKNISFYQMEKIKKAHKQKAENIVKSIDPDDFLFIALHLQTGHKIWTCDKVLSNGLKEKGYDICVTTQEIKAKIFKPEE